MPTTIGLVGCGNWGKNIVRDLHQIGVEVYVATKGRQSQQRAAKLGVKHIVDSSEKLPQLDGYVIATPINELFPETKKLLKRKAPVFSEKTLCASVAQVDELEAAGGLDLVFLMHKWEYHHGVHLLKEIARSGRIGEFEEIHCFRQSWVQDMHGGDVLTGLAVHDLTIVRHILDGIPAPVFARIAPHNATATRLLAVLGQAPQAIVSVSARHPHKLREFTVIGSNGSASLTDPLADHILIRDASGEEKRYFENTMPLYEELEEFVCFLQGGPKPRCGLSQAKELAGIFESLIELARHRV